MVQNRVNRVMLLTRPARSSASPPVDLDCAAGFARGLRERPRRLVHGRRGDVARPEQVLQKLLRDALAAAAVLAQPGALLQPSAVKHRFEFFSLTQPQLVSHSSGWAIQ